MFANFLEKLDRWTERWEERRRIKYLSCASDLADLEKRWRAIDRHGYRKRDCQELQKSLPGFTPNEAKVRMTAASGRTASGDERLFMFRVVGRLP